MMFQILLRIIKLKVAFVSFCENRQLRMEEVPLFPLYTPQYFAFRIFCPTKVPLVNIGRDKSMIAVDLV